MAAESLPSSETPPIPWLTDPGPRQDDAALFAWWRAHGGFNSQADPKQGIDLYDTLVSRHQSDEFRALSFQVGDQLTQLSYLELDAQAIALHARWSQMTLEPGNSLAIVSRNPQSRIIALLAAFRAGLVPTILDTKGPGRTIQEVSWLNPDLVHGDRDLIDLLPEDYRSRSVPLEGTVQPAPKSCGKQPPDALVLRFFNPYKPGPESIQSIKTGTLFNNLLRDSALVLGLGRGSRFATFRDYGPPSPFSELCALFAGGEHISLDPKGGPEARKVPLNQAFDVVHLPLEIATLWCNSIPEVAPNWMRWFRDPLESLDITAWNHVVTALKLETLPCASLHWSLQSGTVILGTAWDNTPNQLNLSPASGIPWQLGDLKSPDTEAKLGFGLYCQISDVGEDAIVLPSPLLLSRHGQFLRLLGTYPKGRSGVPFPARLCKIILSSPGAWHVIVEQESPTEKDVISYVLIAFMDSRSPAEIQTLLEREIGLDAVPDKIQIIPLMPRFDDAGDLDEPWIKRNFLNGELEQRVTRPVYQALSTFKQAIFNTSETHHNNSTLLSDIPTDSEVIHDH